MTALRPANLSDRFERWLLRRLRAAPLPQRIGNRRIYILPTAAGYTFAALVFVLWLGAMNYSNSMGFALAFLLAGLGLVAMHFTHANLLGVELQQIQAAPCHAGDSLWLRLQLRHAGQRPRPALQLHWPRHLPPAAGGGDSVTLDLPAEGQAEAELALSTAQRGWLRLPPLAVATVYPLGLFRAWTWLSVEQRLLIYPALRPAPEPRPPPASSEGERPRSDDGGEPGREDFDSLRDYRRGDALRDIHWKRLPRQETPVVKRFTDSSEEPLWLDWEQLDGDTELRLSRLAWLVCRAADAGLAWGLRLPGVRLPADSGAAHRHRCLRALALHPAVTP